MKKAIIKSLSVVLVVVITLTSAPLSGFVGLELPEWIDFSIEASAATSGSCGDNLTWSYDISTHALTISGTGEMEKYFYTLTVSRDAPWKIYKDEMTSVVIENGATSISDRAFISCKALEKIIIPTSVTSIGEKAFYLCTALIDITIPNSVTSIGDYAFYECDSLSSITIPDGVKKIGEKMFYDCNSLENIVIPESVISIGEYAFGSCDSLESTMIGSGVKTIDSCAFHYCKSLVNITVDNNNQYYSSDEYGVLFNKDKTTLIQYPVGNTRTDYIIPDSVTRIGEYAFYNCDSLTKVTIPNSIILIGDYAFGSCGSLKSITIPDSVTSIGNYAFIACRSLTNITIPDSVKAIGFYTFYNCSGLTINCYSGSYAEKYAIDNSMKYIIIVPSGNLDNGLTWEISDNSLIISGTNENIPSFNQGEAPWSKYASQIEEIYLFTEYVETIGEYAFCGLENVNYINIGSDSLTHIGKYAFGGINVGIDVWFFGTETQWKNVDIDYGNDTLIGSNVYCSKNDSTIDGEHISKPSDDYLKDSFINEHLSFVENDSIVSTLNENSFNNVAVIKKHVLNAYNVWDVLGDVGEVVTLNFNDLTINADYYEMYLSDMILALNNEEETSKLEWKVAEVYNDVYGALGKLLKTSDEWENSVTPSMAKEIENYLTGKSFELGDNTAKILEIIFKDVYKNNKKAFTSVFEGLSMASTVLDGVFAAFDIVNAYVDAYNAYVVSKAFYEVNDEFFDICISAGKRLSYTNDYSQYGKWFLNAVYEAKNSEIGNLGIIFDTAYTLTKSSSVVVYDLFIKEFIKSAVYPTVAKLLGLASAGQLSILAFTYNVTYGILDAVSGLSKASVQYKIINYVTPVEKQLVDVVASKRNTLLSAQSESSAVSYDMAYRILRHTNMYLYEATYKRAAINDDTSDMTYATAGKNLWNRTMCHYGNYGGKYNIFSSRCPVDVYVYDSNGMLVTSVIDEKVVEYDYRITVMTGNGHKSFAYPSDEEFTFVVKAREEGKMDYSFGTLDCATLETEYASYDIELEPEQEFSTTIPISNDECSDDFKLETNDTYIEFDYNSTQICETHTFGEWINGEENKSRVCTVCGYVEYVAVCSHKFETVEVYSIVPTCSDGGHTFYACIGCGIEINDGIDVEATGHNYLDGTCTYCSENKPVPQAMSSQIRFDRNNDGSYAETFAVRTRAMISDKDFIELVGATNTEAINNIDKIGFVYTLDGENFSATSAQAVAQGETVAGYVDAPVKYIQDADGYYMFTCLVTDIPDTDKEYTLTAYAYICVNGKWYFSEAPMNADFNSLYTTYYPVACEKYGWEV